MDIVTWHMGTLGVLGACLRDDNHPIGLCVVVAQCAVCRQGAGNDCQHFVAR